ncbi:MAG: hypothetical protein LBO66_06030 [Deltaproteobacteria bacterium]|jgi:hypothetical protein|nr:hypothetical protein [Deltaproteobacteria bacterium]
MTSPLIFYKPPPVPNGSPLGDSSKPMPAWDVALTAICGSRADFAGDGSSSAMLAEYPDSQEIFHQLELISGVNGPWPEDRRSTKINLYMIQVCTSQLSRIKPLETISFDRDGLLTTVPSDAEILRIKCGLVLLRNSTRDYVDLAALSIRLGFSTAAMALKDFDRFYSLNEERLLLVQLLDMLSTPLPYDLAIARLESNEDLAPEWRDWGRITTVLRKLSVDIFDASCQGFQPRPYDPEENA